MSELIDTPPLSPAERSILHRLQRQSASLRRTIADSVIRTRALPASRVPGWFKDHQLLVRESDHCGTVCHCCFREGGNPDHTLQGCVSPQDGRSQVFTYCEDLFRTELCRCHSDLPHGHYRPLWDGSSTTADVGG